MGISRDSRHKRRNTGGAKPAYRKKRRFDLGRQPAMTKIGAKSIHFVRCHGGMIKRRALKLETGNFSWASEGILSFLLHHIFVRDSLETLPFL